MTNVKIDDGRILISNKSKEQLIRDAINNRFIYINNEYVNVDHIVSIWWEE